jgi:pyrimidine-nucleoside phosphorylase
MTPAQLIRRKREGEELTPDQIRSLFLGYSAGSVAEYQMSAFLMAVCFRGLEPAELDALVEVMLSSGGQADLSAVSGTKVDKHSTGGVGDKVSIALAPLVAALGVPVPMMSGRGLGHTGGTLDKLETIPGFRTDLSLDEFRRQVGEVGCALIGQTAEIAPLDRRLYALRDVTATVESIPLIASSIMSKKLAEGIDALLLDVKVGNGAFLPERERAEELARTMIAIGRSRGREVVALLTAMDRPLGHAVGNALEVEECVLLLRGEGPADLRELTVRQAAEMLLLGGAAPDLEAAAEAAARALDDGRALEKMREVIRSQGGNDAVLDDPAILPQAPVRHVVESPEAGILAAMDVRAIGEAAVALGAGRLTLESAILPDVGFHITVKPGDAVERGMAVATVYARSEEDAAAAGRRLLNAVRFSSEVEPCLPLVLERLTG